RRRHTRSTRDWSSDVCSSDLLLSDLHYRCTRDGIAVPPVLVTLSPCGSLKTLEFMRWLGVSVPRWLENDLKHSADILESSVRVRSEERRVGREWWLRSRPCPC